MGSDVAEVAQATGNSSSVVKVKFFNFHTDKVVILSDQFAEKLGIRPCFELLFSVCFMPYLFLLSG